jgi:hypothetical protein
MGFIKDCSVPSESSTQIPTVAPVLAEDVFSQKLILPDLLNDVLFAGDPPPDSKRTTQFEVFAALSLNSALKQPAPDCGANVVRVRVDVAASIPTVEPLEVGDKLK